MVEQGDVVVAERENMAMVLSAVAIAEIDGVGNGGWLLSTFFHGCGWAVILGVSGDLMVGDEIGDRWWGQTAVEKGSWISGGVVAGLETVIWGGEFFGVWWRRWWVVEGDEGVTEVV